MQIQQIIGFAYTGSSDPELDAEVLQAIMECQVTINRSWLRRHRRTAKLYDSGVRYGRAPCPDGSKGPWESLPDAYRRRIADCKVLTAIRIAELREDGVRCRPVFRTLKLTDRMGRVRKSTHILDETEKPGSFLGLRKIGHEDPSAKLGMKEYYSAQGIASEILP